MKMDTDSEGEDQAPVAPVRDTADDSRKRKAKQAALEAMMDSDSDSAPPEKKSVPSPHPNQPPPSAQPAPSRSRGKRKVKKKVTSKDADGYLNTRYEDTWESCSDEEPAPPPPPEAKTKPMVVGKKGKGQLKGQGTLTSFFKRPT